ncbi:MAG: hypothetical protein HZC51_13205 [Nitrospirae bacterium]|nr:hypothetical protein [Nitrospirota bacterium]
MNWTLSNKLMPGEEVVDQPDENGGFGMKAVYTPVLTNRRVIFKFNSLSTGLVQSFYYDEITDARPTSRLLVKYLKLTARGREHVLHVYEPDSWAWKIMEYKEQFGGGASDKAAKPSAADLLVMLSTLKDNGLLTDAEFEEKRGRLNI